MLINIQWDFTNTSVTVPIPAFLPAPLIRADTHSIISKPGTGFNIRLVKISDFQSSADLTA